jgi:hypothetical protein
MPVLIAEVAEGCAVATAALVSATPDGLAKVSDVVLDAVTIHGPPLFVVLVKYWILKYFPAKPLEAPPVMVPV